MKETDPLAQLVARPNPSQSWREFAMLQSVYLNISAMKKASSKAKLPMQPIATNERSIINLRRIVGVNAYQDEKPYTIPILKMDPQGYKRQVSRLEKLRQERDPGRLGQALDRLRIACQGTENTMPHLLEAVRAYATLGEIVDVLREVFGTYEEPTWI